AGFQSLLKHVSYTHDSDALLLVDHLAPAVLNRRPELLAAVIGCAPRIPEGHRTVIVNGKAEHVRQLPAVLGGHDCHIGNTAQVGQVKDPLMGLPVASHKTRPIYRKDNRQILQSHIMYDLVISSLEEGRIHGKYG